MTGEQGRSPDAGCPPLRLAARDGKDIEVLSAFLQDAVFTEKEVVWNARLRVLELHLSRFRWEDKEAAKAEGRGFHRTRSMLAVRDVMKIESGKYRPGDGMTVFSLLELRFEPGKDGTGVLVFTMAGDISVRLHVECLDVGLTDVGEPYPAASASAPSH